MPRTGEELERAAIEAAVWLDTLDVDNVRVEDPADLRRIGFAVIHRDAAGIDMAVADAQRNGRSWSRIATIVGTSEPEARERYRYG